MKNKVRVRLRFETAPCLLSSVDQGSIKTYMLLINKDKCNSVGDVEKKIRDKFSLPSFLTITLFIDEFALMSSEDVDVIRDNDEIMVVNSGSQNHTQTKTSSDNVKNKKRSKTKEDLEKSCKKSCEAQPSKINGIPKPKEFQSKSDELLHKDVKQPEKLKKHKKSKHRKPSEFDSIPESCVKPELVVTPKKEKSKHKKKKKQTLANNDLLRGFDSISPQKNGAEMVAAKRLGNLELPLNEIQQEVASINQKKRKHCDKIADLISTQNSQNYDGTQNAKISKNYSTMVTLSWPPRVGDVIAFKLLEMAEDYSPMISEFQEASVCGVNGTAPENAVLEFEMLSAVSNKRRSGRFELDLDEMTEERSKEVAWSRLIDPKLVK